MPELKLSASDYWTAATAGTLYTDSDMNVFHISIPDTSVMIPILRETDQTIMEAIEAANKSPGFLKVAINAMYFGLGTASYVGSIDPSELDVEGLVVVNGSIEPRTRMASGLFYVRQEPLTSGYTFGIGDPPLSSGLGIGGAAPIIINGKPYNDVNVYNPAAMTINPLRCELKGEPGSSPNLTPFERNECRVGNVFRSNARFGDFSRLDIETGKVTMGHVPSQSRLLFIVQKHGADGRPIAELRDAYIRLDATNAVFFDGSSSATLFTNDSFVAEPAGGLNYKNRGIPVAIGFI